MKKIVNIVLIFLLICLCTNSVRQAQPLPIVPLLPDFCVMVDTGQQVKITGWQIPGVYLTETGFISDELCTCEGR